MANNNLITGAALVGQSKQTNWVGAFQEGLAQSMAVAANQRMQIKAQKNAIKAKTESYINRLNSNVDLSELTGEQQNAITNFLVKKRREYADAASRISKIDDPASEEYMNLRDQMNGVQLSFNNLAKQLNTYKEDKTNFLEDFDSGMLSDGNEIGVLNEASNLYTDKGVLGVNEGGGLVFWNENKGDYSNYSDVQKPFLKDFKSADSILKLNQQVYSSGAPLTGARRNMIRQQLKSMISQGGRDTLLSLASDDFMVEGGLGLQDPALFEKENESELRNAVLDGYMTALEESAREGYSEKQAKTRSSAGRSMSALDREIAASGSIREDAAEFSKFAGIKAENTEDKASVIATELNAMDPSSSGQYMTRSEVYNGWLEGTDKDHDEESIKEFIKLYPRDYQLFYVGSSLTPKPVSMNINDPMELYEFYINNSNISNKAKNHIITGTRQSVRENSNKETANNKAEQTKKIDTSKYNQ
jgi:hypothetical protein